MTDAQETCRGTRDNGEPCRSPFTGEDGYCDAHRPGNREVIRERGRRGAQVANANRRYREAIQPDELPPLDSHAAAKRWLEVVGRAVATERIGAQEGNTLCRVISTWLDAHSSEIVAEDLEALRSRLSTLEEELEKRARAA